MYVAPTPYALTTGTERQVTFIALDSSHAQSKSLYINQGDDIYQGVQN